MNVQHFEKGIRYTDKELLFVARKLGKLATYCRTMKDASSSIRLEAERRQTEKDRDQVKVMITVTLPKKVLRAESRRADIVDAVDRCIEKMEPQIKRYKEKHSGRERARKMRKLRLSEAA
ncbi:MAG: ribosome-associated translation inhibitor RaiA [Candidatus Peregrinibacteria bacterium]|nr:ribosome-associated translation inhibitor RaiA [Candidatus Peregrinibacteria bacterium]